MATTGILTNPDVEVDVGLVKATLSRYGVDPPKRASVKKVVSLLRNSYKEWLEDIPEENWIKCLVCGEITDDDEELECCPYCGDDGAEPEEADAAEEAGPVDLEPEEDDDGDDIEVDEPEKLSDDEDPEADAKRKARHEKAEKAAKGDDADVINVEESPEDDTTEEAPEVDLDSEDEPTAVVVAEETTKIDASTAEGKLAMATQRAKVAQRSIATNGWDLGHVLIEINEAELWKAGGFSSFKDYYTKELGISKALVYNLMDVAKKFTRSTFEDIGIKKLEIVARAPKESREKLLDDAGKSSKRELEKKAREEKRKAKEKEKAEKGSAPPPEPKSPTQAGGKRGRPSKEDQTITLLTKVGGKPKTYRFKDGTTHEEIPEWTKDAYVEVKLSDDVMLYVAPKTDRSGKKLTKLAMMFRKIEDGAEK